MSSHSEALQDDPSRPVRKGLSSPSRVIACNSASTSLSTRFADGMRTDVREERGEKSETRGSRGF